MITFCSVCGFVFHAVRCNNRCVVIFREGKRESSREIDDRLLGLELEGRADCWRERARDYVVIKKR